MTLEVKKRGQIEAELFCFLLPTKISLVVVGDGEKT
jgi:hypothetical protein